MTYGTAWRCESARGGNPLKQVPRGVYGVHGVGTKIRAHDAREKSVSRGGRAWPARCSSKYQCRHGAEDGTMCGCAAYTVVYGLCATSAVLHDPLHPLLRGCTES